MSRQRDHDLDEEFDISIGLSDMEKEDEEVIDALADVFKTVEIKKPKVNIQEKIKLKKKSRKRTLRKCHIYSISSSSLLLTPSSCSVTIIPIKE